MIRKLLLGVLSHRVLALLRWDIYFFRVRLMNRLMRVNGKISKHVRSMPDVRYLNLGSGPRGISDPTWLNIDGFWDTNVQFVIDFSRPLPIPDSSMDGIFCEHVLEHFDLEGGTKLLQECCRILKPGGGARFIMPNGARIMKTYFDDPAFLVEKRAAETGTAMEAVNSWFRQRYEHQLIYDWELSRKAFGVAGFSRVENASYKASETLADTLLIDDEKYAWESLYIDAIK